MTVEYMDESSGGATRKLGSSSASKRRGSFKKNQNFTMMTEVKVPIGSSGDDFNFLAPASQPSEKHKQRFNSIYLGENLASLDTPIREEDGECED